MYVVRPQQAVFNTPGCSSVSSKGRHFHDGRQTAKNQRRTQPKLRRPQAQQRRREKVRELVGNSGHRLRLSAEATQPHGGGAGGSADAFDEFLDPAGDRRRKGSARARLCARLLQRSSAELVTALERRHGDKWPEHVLRGDFQTIQALRSLCEAFCLRPALEHQVIKATTERARAILSGSAEASSGGGVAGRAAKAQADDDGVDAAPSPTSKRSRAHSTEDTASTCDGDSVAGTLDGTCSEATSADEDQDIATADEAEGVAEVVAGSSSGGSSSECESAEPWKQTWRSRVLRALGLPRLKTLWDGISETDTPEKQQDAPKAEVESLVEARIRNEEADAEEEEEALSVQLVTAVRNAELQSVAARASLRHRADSDGLSHTAAAAALANAAAAEAAETDGRLIETKARNSEVRFARESEVSFFSCQSGPSTTPEASALEYRRPLDTKVFDGPSGHKARRTSESKASDDDEQPPAPSAAALWGGEDPEDEAEEWEDRCDDIAELMSQQRSCLLWSAAW